MENKCIECNTVADAPYSLQDEGKICSEDCYMRYYNKNYRFRDTIINLVTLAIKANDVIIQGSFKGSISDEVHSVLEMCKAVHEQYVEECNGNV